MISIFAKRAFLNTSPNTEFVSKEENYHGNGHLQRVSSMIRADQIAAQIGAKLNPEKHFDKDVCIYVKPHVQADNDFQFRGKRVYLDIIDGWGLVPLLEKHPEVSVIACSKQDFALLSRILPNKAVFIPQHHCNFDNLTRTRKSIKTVGIIGTEKSFENLPKGLEQGLAQRGIKLIKYSKFFTRQDIIEFYQNIDLQLVWRPYRMRLSNPLKIVNAASFGIPTIAYDETVFEEVNSCYVPANDLEGIYKAIDLLTNPAIYEKHTKNCLEIAKKYHIREVGDLYKTL